MNVTSESKPRLRKAGGVWFCSDYGLSAQGPTPKDAYREYKRQRIVMDKWGESDPHKYGNALPGASYGDLYGDWRH